MREIYCDERDHLIKRKEVNAFKLRILNIDGNTRTLLENVSRFDGKTNLKVNGYRSIVRVTMLMIDLCLEEGQEIVTRIKNLNTFKTYLNYWTAPLNAIDNLLKLTVDIMELAENNLLYPDNPNAKTERVVELSKKLIDLDITPFYGEFIGFHLKGDCSKMGRLLNIALAYYSNFFGGSLREKIGSLKKLHYGYYYITNYQELAKQVVEASRSLQVDFAQSFYNMAEFPLFSPFKFLPKISTNHLMNINFEQLETESKPHKQYTLQVSHTRHALYSPDRMKKFKVPIPSSHIKKNFVQARLIADYRTVQMLGACQCVYGLVCSCQFTFAKDAIMFHVHGGGFISQTSESHLEYLLEWSSRLKIPILSIDYSLAPEAPYPRAVEEVLYCYVWMLNNFPALGTTGKKIICSGQFQHSFLLVVVQLRLELNIKIAYKHHHNNQPTSTRKFSKVSRHNRGAKINIKAYIRLIN